MKPKAFQAQRLDVQAFADAAALLQGELDGRSMPRLTDALLTASDAPAQLRWRAQGGRRKLAAAGSLPGLALSASGSVPLQCQRCLGVVQVELLIDRGFAFAPDEAEAARLDESSDDDVLVASRAFDLLELLEDELILALPIVPRHEDCQPPAMAQATQPPVESERQRPFEALKALRRQD